MTESVRIILVDDHTLFRKGLAELLERHDKVSVVGMSGNSSDARALLDEHKPDVAVIDLNMPDIDGITLLGQLRAEGYALPILLLTVSDAQDDLAAALRAGARGYLLKNMEPDEVEAGFILTCQSHPRSNKVVVDFDIK